MVRFGASASHPMANSMQQEVKMVPSKCGRTALDHTVCGARIESNLAEIPFCRSHGRHLWPEGTMPNVCRSTRERDSHRKMEALFASD